MKNLLRFIIFVAILPCKAELNKYNLFDSTRYPVFAGQFYSSDSIVLKKQLETFFKNSKTLRIDSIISLIVPHAGYIYSGQIVADAFNQVRNNNYELIIILGTNHTKPNFSKISIYPRGDFVTPIGSLEIDNLTAQKLLSKDNNIVADLSVHAKEHSIEVQIPFIKYLFPRSKILPIIIGSSDIQMCKKFGKILAEIIKDKNALIIASSDLSHYPNFDDAIKVDNKILKTITKLDVEEIIYSYRKE